MSNTNVLMIDDDRMFNFIHAKVVKSANLDLEVKTFDQADTALKELSISESCDDCRFIIFVDINMPEVDGWDFLEGLSLLPDALLDTCEVFMLSSSNDLTDIKKSRTFSIVKGYVAKPLTVRQVQGIYRKEYSSLLASFHT